MKGEETHNNLAPRNMRGERFHLITLNSKYGHFFKFYLFHNESPLSNVYTLHLRYEVSDGNPLSDKFIKITLNFTITAAILGPPF